jgi:hypothetical protein
VTFLEDPLLRQLRREGVRVLACAQSAVQRRIPLGTQATFGGLGLLIDLLVGVDRFLAVGPGSPSDGPLVPRHHASTRDILITLLDECPAPPRIAEALRVAAGLRAGGQLPVTLATTATLVREWARRCRADPDSVLAEHLRLFLSSGGQILTPQPQPEHPDAPGPDPYPPHRRLPAGAWETRLSQGFAIFPL